jgi:ABC-type sulfate transport system substrate-binding protein
VSTAGERALEIVVPSITLLAEPPVSIVDAYPKQHGTESAAPADLDSLDSADGRSSAEPCRFNQRQMSCMIE